MYARRGFIPDSLLFFCSAIWLFISANCGYSAILYPAEHPKWTKQKLFKYRYNHMISKAKLEWKKLATESVLF